MKIFFNLKSLVYATVFITFSAKSQSINGDMQKKLADSLCNFSEDIVFSCKIGPKTLSICAWKEKNKKGGVIYRFGRKKHIELEATELHQAHHGWSGGGETQIYADTSNHRYIVYDNMIRLGVDDEGHNIPSMTQGLVVLSKGRIISKRFCTEIPGAERPGFNWRWVDLLIPPGPYIDH